MQAESQPEYPLLFSLRGFRYCDLLLAAAERAAWLAVLANGGRQPAGSPRRVPSTQETPVGSRPPFALKLAESCHAVAQRATQTLKWSTTLFNHGLLTVALDHLTLGRAALYAAILQGSEISDSKSEIEQAVSGLRRAGQQDELPKAQLTWTVRVPDGPTSMPLGVAVAVAGKPTLNAARNGVTLTQVTLEDVRVTGVPVLFGLGLAQLGERKGASLPDLPLMSLPPEELTRKQVAYGATAVAVTFTGLRIDLEPK